ncbi:hypothetical protein LSH36_186g03005, partial [Paralvinella palmiformis]
MSSSTVDARGYRNMEKNLPIWSAAVLLLTLITAAAYPLSIKEYETTSLCSQNMPCQWSFCPWTRYSVIIPEDERCTTITNVACRCPWLTSCAMKDADITPLAVGGASFVKLEYNCQLPRMMKIFGTIG